MSNLSQYVSKEEEENGSELSCQLHSTENKLKFEENSNMQVRRWTFVWPQCTEHGS